MTTGTIFRLGSMTEAMTSVAAMQLVEQGKLTLDEPIAKVLPQLAAPQVLIGFDSGGAPQLRPAKRPITLHHLLTHTAGFAYDIWDPAIQRYIKVTNTPAGITGKLASLNLPLVFDPSERWEYGISLDWVGRAVEAVSGQPLDAYFRDHILGPLGMTDTDYLLSPAQHSRLVTAYQRKSDTAYDPLPEASPPKREFGLYSTAHDYLVFLQMLMHQGSFHGVRLLHPETVALMGRNQIGNINAGILNTANPTRSNDVDFFPGIPCKWGVAYMINTLPGPNGRSADSLTWAGIYNTYYWLDPRKHVAGVVLTQILPFADRPAIALYGRFERAVYDALAA
jgi:CubicO group peptidase (beta-lactamase class C family)